jgi:hypothetical protein
MFVVAIYVAICFASPAPELVSVIIFDDSPFGYSQVDYVDGKLVNPFHATQSAPK